jgi:hypothetical protein
VTWSPTAFGTAAGTRATQPKIVRSKPNEAMASANQIVLAGPRRYRDLPYWQPEQGIARAKTEGVCHGRPASIDAAKVREMKARAMGAAAIAKALHSPRERHGSWRRVAHKCADRSTV